jgi:serine/threonine-protein kinase RsbW
VVQRYHLLVTTNLEDLILVLQWFNQICQSVLSRETLIQAQTALAEAFTNAVRHAHAEKAAEAPIELEVCLGSNQLEICIWDSGPEFDLERCLRSSTLKKRPDAVGGRGIYLITQLTDQFSYRRTTDERNCLRMIKLLRTI